MNIAVGLIGAGVMGSEHARILAQDTVGATLAGVCDADIGKAQNIAGYAPVCKDPLELINSSHIDAILIASPDATHAELVLACIKTGKPVLCEKPLAMTSYQALAIVNAECRLGKKLVQVGYMRRFDPGYQELKARFYENALGAPEILHNVHRNPTAPEWMTGKMLITNAFVHEIDVARWLLRSELTSVSITAAEKGDPMVITARMSNGTIVSTELFMNCKYGYYVHAELVCSDGVISLPPFASSIVSHTGQQLSFVPKNWIPRFRAAYQAQTNSWIKSIITGVSTGGATAWDGFVTTLVAEQLVEKVGSSQVIELATPACPELYL